MTDALEKLDQLAADGVLHGFTIWKTSNGYQANMQSGGSSGWRVRRGDTPSKAIALVLDMDWIDTADDALGMAPLPIRDVEAVDFGEAAIADLVEESEAVDWDEMAEIRLEQKPAKPSLFD